MLYIGNNVIVDKPILFNCSRTMGDRLCIVQNHACIRKKLICIVYCEYTCGLFVLYFLRNARNYSKTTTKRFKKKQHKNVNAKRF